MSQITNIDKEKFRGDLGEYYIDGVDSSFYESNQSRIYDDSYGNHNIRKIDEALREDNGMVPLQIEENFDAIADKAIENIPVRNYIIDWKTSNKSFIDLHRDLKKLGIRNNTFFLRLYDTDLIGVDPFSPILPLEMQLKIFLECIVNPWYFLREVARIPVDGKPIEPGGGTQYRIDRNNLATWYLFLNGIDTYASKPRQCGKTQDALLKLNYAYHFGARSATILFFNKDASLSKENLARLKDQRDMLPVYMQMKVAFTDDGKIDKETDNITTMKNPITKNQVKVMPRATSRDAAMRIGRGFTASLAMFDEFDFTNYNIDIVDASVFAYSTASQNAKENNSLFGRLFLSTPGDLSNRDGLAATNFINGSKSGDGREASPGMLKWKDEYLDTPIDELKRAIYSPAYNGIVFVEHSWKQLKKSMEWYEKQCNLVGYKQEVILREIELKRLHGSSLSPFTRDQQLYLASHVREPKTSVDLSGCLSPIDIYEDLQRNYPYILAIDPSDGVGEDNNAFTLINPYSLKPAAEFKCSYISPKNFFKMCVNFLDRYCPLSCIVVESNRGRELLQYFSDSRYRYQVWIDEDKLNQVLSVKTDKYGGIKQDALARKVQGLNTNGTSRDRMFNILREFVMERIDILYSKNLVADILNLIRKPTTGRIEAAPGQHDDNVMSYLIGIYVYRFATNLSKYGIIPGSESPETKSKRKETKSDIKNKIRSAINQIPEEYRDLFQNVLDEKDGIDDSRQYTKEVEFQKRQYDRFAAATMFDEQSDLDPERIEEERQKNLQMGFYNYGPPGIGTDIPTDMDQEAFEKSIFDLNFQNNQEFNIDDYI